MGECLDHRCEGFKWASVCWRVCSWLHMFNDKRCLAAGRGIFGKGGCTHHHSPQSQFCRYALGGGAELALACDFRVCGESLGFKATTCFPRQGIPAKAQSSGGATSSAIAAVAALMGFMLAVCVADALSPPSTEWLVNVPTACVLLSIPGTGAQFAFPETRLGIIPGSVEGWRRGFGRSMDGTAAVTGSHGHSGPLPMSPPSTLSLQGGGHAEAAACGRDSQGQGAHLHGAQDICARGPGHRWVPARGSWLGIGWQGDLGARSFPPCAPACDSGCSFSPLSPLKYQI